MNDENFDISRAQGRAIVKYKLDNILVFQITQIYQYRLKPVPQNESTDRQRLFFSRKNWDRKLLNCL